MRLPRNGELSSVRENDLVMDAETNNPSLQRDQQPNWLSRSALLTMLLTGLFAIGFGQDRYKTLASHEIYTAVSARGMLETGEYIIPYQANQPRLAKPPLGYWVILPFAAIAGEVNELTARFPALLSGILLCLLLGHWAGEWYGKAVRVPTMFVTATSFYCMIFARKSEVDLLLTLINVAALYLIASQPAGQSWRQGFGRWTLIFGLLGLSMLAKFHYGPAMVLAPCAVYWAVQRRWRDVLHGINPLGWLLFVGPLAGWIFLVTQRLPNAWAIWEYETIGRAVGDVFSSRPAWFYVGPLLWMTLPWTFFWIGQVPHSWRSAWKEQDPHERFLWITIGVQLAIVSLQPDKHPQYLLSTLPLLTLWSGRGLSQFLAQSIKTGWQINRATAVGFGGLAIAGSLAIALLIESRWPWLRWSGVTLSVCLAVGLILSLWLNRTGQLVRSLQALCLTFTASLIVVFGFIYPGQDHWRAQAEFSQRVRQLAGDETVTGFGLWFSPLYYLGSNLENYYEKQQLRNQLLSKGELIVVSFRANSEELEQLGELDTLLEMNEQELRLAGNDPRLGCWKLRPKQALRVAQDPSASEPR